MNCGTCCSDSTAGNTIQSASDSEGFKFDTFSRAFIDAPTTIFITHSAFTAQSNILDYRSTGTGSFFVDTSNSLVQMTVSGSGGRCVRQSREYLLYQPGKSQLVLFTMTPLYSGTLDTSVAVRGGLFDDYRDKNTLSSTNPGNSLGKEVNQKSQGHFFELSGNQWFVVERYNSENNTTNVTRVAQANWSIDTLNGNLATSKSGYILPTNPTAGLLFFIDRQWLGVGMVRMGVYFNGAPIYCHAFQGRTLNRPYTQLAKLPVRWEIEKVSGGSSDSVSMAAICASVQVGGQFLPFGFLFSLPANLTITQRSVDTTLRPILLIRLQQRYCRATVKILNVELLNTNTNNADGAFEIVKNPTISGVTPTYTKHPDPRSMIEYYFVSPDKTATLSNGIVSRAGFFSSRTQIQDQLNVDEVITAPSYCSDIYGNSDVLCLAISGVKPTGGDITVCANLRWIELI